MTITHTMHTTSRRIANFMVAAALCLATAVTAHAQAPLTLQEAIQIALDHNISLKLAQGEQKIAYKNYHLGNAGFLPTVDAYLRGEATHPTQPQADTTAQVIPGIELKWTVFNGLAGFYTYQQLGQRHRIAQLQTQQALQTQVAAVIKAYYALVLAQQKQRVLEGALAVAQQVRDMVQQQYQLGQGTQLDYLTAQVQYNTEHAQLLAHEEALHTAQVTLQVLLGKEFSPPLTVVNNIPPPQKLSWDSLSQALEATNPAWLLAQQRRQEAAINVKLQYAKLWPQIDLKLGYQGEKPYVRSQWGKLSQGAHYGVSLRFNLFNALQHYTDIQVARLGVAQAQLRSAAQQQQLQATLKQRFMRYTQQLQRCAMAQQHVQVSQQSAALALEQYQLGKISLLALHKAKQSAQQTALQQLQAAYDAKVAEVALQQLCGTLLLHQKSTLCSYVG